MSCRLKVPFSFRFSAFCRCNRMQGSGIRPHARRDEYDDQLAAEERYTATEGLARDR
jgi:hypothetical protein